MSYFDEMKAAKINLKNQVKQEEELTSRVKILNQRKSYDFTSTPNSKTP
jgi:hypothetical protein